jgi:putative ABC transport system substrate-binding protein
MQFDQLRRRDFITLIGGAAAWPLAGLAQEADKVRRIGFLRVGEPPAAFIDSFRRGLREVGLVEGRDYVIEFALPQHTAQVPAAAAQLVRRRVDILLASGTPSVLPARDAAGQILITWPPTIRSGTVAGVESKPRCGRGQPKRGSVLGCLPWPALTSLLQSLRPKD